ncbi:hypothetical protein CN156_21425 [Sinorhizobium meliloti]|uniref:DUF6074 family protein n=1 Tax=Rhizobium meliloti TaxID=382 RepID=UPI000FD894D6|nr:DUF6074 family protein [Sinorhizobium meliloti]RVK26508.1 hypothetical protein CN156_21425 [Sinorhizobium meliloti]
MAVEFGERTMVRGGEVVAFPLASRASDVDRCARELDRIHGAAAVRYWKSECRKLAEQLSALGLREDEIRNEILAFQAEVQTAIAGRYQEPAARNRSDSRP